MSGRFHLHQGLVNPLVNRLMLSDTLAVLHPGRSNDPEGADRALALILPLTACVESEKGTGDIVVLIRDSS